MQLYMSKYCQLSGKGTGMSTHRLGAAAAQANNTSEFLNLAGKIISQYVMYILTLPSL